MAYYHCTSLLAPQIFRPSFGPVNDSLIALFRLLHFPCFDCDKINLSETGPVKPHGKIQILIYF